MSSVEKKIEKEAYNIDRRKWIDQRWKKVVNSNAEIEQNWTGVCISTLFTMNEVTIITDQDKGQMNAIAD
jgi:hypothetical protein